MAVTISVIFDSEDMADFARARLRERGVDYGDCSVERTRKNAPGYSLGMNLLANPYVPIIGMSLAQTYTEMPIGTSFNGFSYAGGENAVETLANDIIPDSQVDEPQSEVKMSLRVRSEQAEVAESILTSCHGMNIRRG